MDFIESGKLSVDQVKLFVLDEAGEEGGRALGGSRVAGWWRRRWF